MKIAEQLAAGVSIAEIVSGQLLERLQNELDGEVYFACENCPAVVLVKDAENVILNGTLSLPGCVGQCKRKAS